MEKRSLRILPRASKYLDLAAILCVPHATDMSREALAYRIYGILNCQLLDNDYPNDSRPTLKCRMEDTSVSSDVIRQCTAIVWGNSSDIGKSNVNFMP
jgi:hypothetical protein